MYKNCLHIGTEVSLNELVFCAVWLLATGVKPEEHSISKIEQLNLKADEKKQLYSMSQSKIIW